MNWLMNWLARLALGLALLIFGCLGTVPGHAGDWPMWRYDAERSAASPHNLPEQLSEAWRMHFTPRVPVWDDPLNQDLMSFDRNFEPVVLDGRLFLAFNDSDRLACFDAIAGGELWSFFADGPIRFAPVARAGRVYCVSDDGHLYCLHAETGALLWKVRGGPTDQQVLGNRRLISMWPARGGPVLRDGTVYFAAGIWPWLGTFLHAVDAETGAVRWVNDSTAAQYIKQPHSAASFGGVAPQGALAATDEFLVVPGGRSVPAVFDRRTGQQLHFLLNEGGKGTGGAVVMAQGPDLYVHTRQRGVRKLELLTGKKTEVLLNEPVLCGDLVFTSDATHVRAIRADQTLAWEFPADGSADLIRAGSRLYAAGASEVSVLQLADDPTHPPRLALTLPAEGVQRLIAAANSLIAVCSDGTIRSFQPAKSSSPATPSVTPPSTTMPASDRIPASDRPLETLLAEHECAAGYALIYGLDHDHIGWLEKLIGSSQLHCIVVDHDAMQIQAVRAKYHACGLYGSRVSAVVANPHTFRAPPYFAHLVVWASKRSLPEPSIVANMYRSVRPYGGLLWIPSGDEEAYRQLHGASLAKAQVTKHDTWGVVAKRVGSLPGAAPWTHLYANMANTVKSDDQLVKLPLGILWFGGNSHADVLPRHSHGPAEQVIGGRLFVEGMNSITARDVYTGRTLWHRDFGDLGTKGIFFDDTYKDTPLDPAYNQVHIPGANARGTNYVVTEDRLYVAVRNICHVLDPRNGQTQQIFTLPLNEEGESHQQWTYIGVTGDTLFAGTDFGQFSERDQFTFAATAKKGTAWSPAWNGSAGMAALDRYTGTVRWRLSARYSFLHNGIVAAGDSLFLLDKLPQSIEDQNVRRGQPKPTDYRIVCVDVSTGAIRWERTEKVFGTWLGYSQPHDVLCVSGSASTDRATDDVGQGMLAIRGQDGAILWENPTIAYHGPPILHGKTIITNSKSNTPCNGMYQLTDGQPVLVANPLTGHREPWQYVRTYGCNTAVASEYLLTFRSGAASYYDLKSQCGVGNWGGFRSGCSSNLIAADGVLNAPDFTRTCSCGYQNQTSLALVHMPDLETWTINPYTCEDPAHTIRQIGINFGAPGARRAEDGTLWIEFPPVHNHPMPLDIQVEGLQVNYYRRHSTVSPGALPWVAASGVEGATRIRLGSAARPLPDHHQYRLRLHFAEPQAQAQRKFDISVQGERTVSHCDPLRQSGGPFQICHVVCEAVRPRKGEISIDLTAHHPEFPPILSGLELMMVDGPAAEP